MCRSSSAPPARASWTSDEHRGARPRPTHDGVAPARLVPGGEAAGEVGEQHHADRRIAFAGTLAEDAEIAARASDGASVRLLWDVCRIPDFRSISPAEHSTMLARIFGFLQDGGVPGDWLATQVSRIDKTAGDIDTLSKRLAYIRTWTYVAQRGGWVRDEAHWRGETRAVEDRLSDALHAALTAQFVDRRTSVLLRPPASTG